MSLRISAILGVLLVVLIAASGATAASQSHINDGKNHVAINQCTTITEPGRYVLDADLFPENRRFCIVIEDTEDVVLNAENHTISGDLFASVYVMNSRNVTIRNIVINSTKRAEMKVVHGIMVVSSERVRVIGNTLRNSTHAPTAWGGVLFLKSEDLYVRDNLVDGRGFQRESGNGSGIRFRDSRNITVVNNTIFGSPTSIGIGNSSNTTVKGNHLEGNVYGIQIGRQSSGILVQANTIINHSLCPLVVKYSSDVEINGNYFKQHGGLALAINASNVSITNNVLKDSTHYGILVARMTSSVVITNNTVVNSSRIAGIAVFSRVTGVTIKHNTISNNTPHGILLKQDVSRITISNNSIMDNTNSGIMILPPVEEVTIAENRILGQPGLNINNSASHGVTIEHNELSDGKEIEGDAEAPGQPGFGLAIALVALVLYLSLTWRFR